MPQVDYSDNFINVNVIFVGTAKGVRNAATRSGIHSITVTWDQPRGEFTGYELTLATMEDYLDIEDQGTEKHVVIDDPKTTRHKFTELEAETEYVVEIYVVRLDWKSDMIQLVETTGKWLEETVCAHFVQCIVSIF